jgi:hypothetical protein
LLVDTPSMVLTMTFHIVHVIAAFALLIIPAVMALPPVNPSRSHLQF